MRAFVPSWIHSVGPLALADLRHRYAGSVLGGLWAVLGPFVEVAAYVLVFTLVLRPTGKGQGLSYALFVAAGLLPWSSLREALEGSAATLADNRWFRRSRVPMQLLVARQAVAAAARGAVGIVLVLLAVVTAGPWPGVLALSLPLAALGLQTVGAYGLGLVLAPAATIQPDLRPALASILTLLTFASPILYPEGLLPPRVVALLAWNPYTHLLRLYRAPLPGVAAVHVADGLVALAVTALLVAIGGAACRRLSWAARDRL